uniref:Uncharacterized protein n=1 Tax=Hyaloperonospora arabidopsidis (strain Emoy2) TaxID=559515 RepID=M4B3W1_HYAAE
MVRCGTTLSKVKSRYGIETDTELKMLRVLRRGDVRAIKVTPKTLDATRFRIVCQLLIQRRPPAVRRRFTVLLPLLWAHLTFQRACARSATSHDKICRTGRHGTIAARKRAEQRAWFKDTNSSTTTLPHP